MKTCIFKASTFLLGFLLLGTNYSHASDLNETITNLYGGDGITLEDNPFFSHAAHFTQNSLTQLQNFSQSLTSVDLPNLSSISGLSFSYDPILDAFVQSTNSLSASLAEQPQTTGKGKFSIGVSYGYSEYDKLDGHNLNNTQVNLNHIELPAGVLTCLAPGFPNPPPDDCYNYLEDVIQLDLDIKLKSQFIGLSASYGLLDNVDISIQLPIIHTELKVSSTATIVNDPSIRFSPIATNGGSVHAFDPINADSPYSSESDSHTGFGDLLLNAKHFFYDTEKLDMAAYYQLRFPTGDEDNFQGIKDLGGKLMLIAAATLPVESGILTPFLNVGLDINASNSGQDKLVYNVGLEYNWSIADHAAAISADVIGENTLSHNARNGSGNNQYDLGLGFKYAITQRNLFYSNIILPVNDSGLRASTTYLVGWSLSL